MHIFNRKPKIRISVSIDEEQWRFCRTNGINISQLLRHAIVERRKQLEGSSVDYRLRMENWQKTAKSLRAFLEENNLLDQWITKETEPSEEKVTIQ